MYRIKERIERLTFKLFTHTDGLFIIRQFMKLHDRYYSPNIIRWSTEGKKMGGVCSTYGERRKKCI